MTRESLAAALAGEHCEIHDGIERFSVAHEDREPLQAAIAAPRRHLYLEEQLLFPALQTEDGAGLAVAIFVMLREHAQVSQTSGAATRTRSRTSHPLQWCHELLVPRPSRATTTRTGRATIGGW